MFRVDHSGTTELQVVGTQHSGHHLRCFQPCAALQPSASTMVTAYFSVKSKHTHGEYMDWMRNMLSLQDAMVIYTAPSLIQEIRKFREHACSSTCIVAMNLEDTRVNQEFGPKFWQDQHQIDPERHKVSGHNSDVYRIWNEKFNFVQLAASSNPFLSENFMWSDIGCYRDSKYNGRTQMTDTSLLKSPYAILVVNIWPYQSEDIANPFFTQCDGNIKCRRIAAAQFAGSRTAIMTTADLYYKTLSEFKHGKHFAGNDQNVMARMCLLHPTRF